MNTFLRQAHAWIDRRLERRIAAYSVAAILGISLVFGSVSLAATFWIIQQHHRANFEHRFDRIVARLDDKVNLFVRHTQDLSKNPIVVTALLDSKGRNIYLVPFFAHYRFPLAESHGLALCDFEGSLLVQQKWRPVGCLADLPQSRAVIDAEQPQTIIATIEQKPYLVLFQPVFYPGTGRAEGYILAALDVHALVAERDLVGPNATLTLRSADGRFHFAARAGAIVAPPEPTDEQPTRTLFAGGPFASAGLTLILHEPTDWLTGAAPLLLSYGLGTLALLALTLALSRQLAHRLAEPLLALNHTTRRIAIEGPAIGLPAGHRTDEVGELAASFNLMIAALRQAQKGLEAQVQTRTEELQQALIKVRQSDKFTHAILDSMDSHIAVLDRNGVIVMINQPWRRFGLTNGIESSNAIWHPGVGVNYLEVCQKAIGKWSEQALAACEGIQAVLLGQRSSFALEYPCHSPRDQRWFIMRVTPLGTENGGVVIAHTDITERKVAEQALQQSELRFRTLFMGSKVAMLLIDPVGGDIVDANAAAANYYGYAVERLRRMKISDINILSPEQIAKEICAAKQGKRSHFFFRHRLASGEVRHVEVHSGPLRLDDRSLLYSIIHDITERKQMDEALRESESRFHTLVDLLPYGVQENDLTGRITFANLALEDLHGQWEGGVVGRFIWDFLADDAEREALRDYLQFLVCEQPPPTPYFAKNRRANGDFIDVQVDWSYRRDKHGQVQSFIAVVTDITDRNRMQARLRDQAIRDPLTGLFNRRYMDETLPRELSRCQRNGEPLTVAMLDLDHFKHFNDIYGHEAGDAVLRSVGDLLNGSVRAGDIACRYGGEELTVIMPGSAVEDSWSRLDSLRRAIMQLHLHYRNSELPVITVSIGIAAAEPAETDAAALLSRADAALYIAKEKGRNRVVVAGNLAIPLH